MRRVPFLTSITNQRVQHIETLDKLAVVAKIVGAALDEHVVQDYCPGSATTEDEIDARVRPFLLR